MINIIVGNIDKIRKWMTETYDSCVFTEDIFEYINECSLFSIKKDNVYFLYDSNIKLDKKAVKEFDNKEIAELADTITVEMVEIVTN